MLMSHSSSAGNIEGTHATHVSTYRAVLLGGPELLEESGGAEMGVTQRRLAAGAWPACRRSPARRHAVSPMAVCRAAAIAIALELVTQCVLVESQTSTNFVSAGRQSYTQPESQNGVLTRTADGPPYRDVNDAVCSPRPSLRASLS